MVFSVNACPLPATFIRAWEPGAPFTWNQMSSPEAYLETSRSFPSPLLPQSISKPSVEVNRLIDSFAKQRVVLYGDLVLDRFVLGTPKRISREARLRAERLLGENRKALDQLATELIARETMEREEFEKLLILNGIKPKTHERISPEPPPPSLLVDVPGFEPGTTRV